MRSLPRSLLLLWLLLLGVAYVSRRSDEEFDKFLFAYNPIVVQVQAPHDGRYVFIARIEAILLKEH